MPAIDVTDATFEAEVLERSVTTPVLIDLWAEWCTPCKTLGPIIERVVDATDGAVLLAKVDIDSNPRVASAFSVQSIPAVFAIKDRKIVDRFIGALPERDVAEFVSRLLPPQSEADELAETGDEGSLRKALELEPANENAITALASLLVDRGDSEEALALMARIPETPALRRIAARARLPEPEGGNGWTHGAIGTKIAELLGKVPGDDDARQLIVDLIATLDPEDADAAKYRRQLASKLF